jgi:putative ABC transport system ATP-binding protein
MLRTKGLEFYYDDVNRFVFPDMHCERKEHCIVLGLSGKGKSTLLHLLCGLMRPQAGSIEIAGTNLASLSEKDLDHFRGQHIGIIFQKPHFVRSLTVFENLALARQLAGNKQDPDKINQLLERLHVSSKSGSKSHKLSQGEQQRVAIARALINHPDLILADEPTSALDDQNCERVFHLLVEQADVENASLVIVTHDARLKNHFTKQYILG